ncbi:MAG: hypothetical protein JJ693_06355 [Acidithiobacillus sp.]|nr:hypothetical protein [Acidithiobacillus sp.]
MKKPKTKTILMFFFLLLWAAAMIALVIIGFTSLQPAGIGNLQNSATRSAPPGDS